jgi:hypothetical protein
MGTRITITVREPVKREILKLGKKEDRPLSEMASILIEEALERRK